MKELTFNLIDRNQIVVVVAEEVIAAILRQLRAGEMITVTVRHSTYHIPASAVASVRVI